MDRQIGFIGCGQMGQAILSGMLRAEAVSPAQVKVSTGSRETLEQVKLSYKVDGSLDNREIAAFADILFLAVSPSLYNKVIDEIKDSIRTDALIITIAAGYSIERMEKAFGKKVKIVRTMPNTPSLAGEGMTAFAVNDRVSPEETEEVRMLLGTFGKSELLKEELMDAVPAISGSSPAYVYMLIEALADGGVRDGIGRNQAYQMAAQAVLGAARMVLETGMHPGKLKDNVCTPGGSTIEAVAKLEEAGFRNSILQAMKACTDKNKAMSSGE